MAKGQEIQRGRNKRHTKPVVIIVCEGKVTEPKYFGNFKGRHKPIKIEIVKGAAGKNYDALIKEADRAVHKHVIDTDGSYSVWCVSDVDVDHNTPGNYSTRNDQLKKYVAEAKSRKFEVALSNPCFELWFLLHFTPNPGYMRDYDAVKKELSVGLPNYQKNSDVYSLLAANQATAIDNAKSLEQIQKQNKTDLMDVTVNPYTSVWKLVEAINFDKFVVQPNAIKEN